MGNDEPTPAMERARVMHTVKQMINDSGHFAVHKTLQSANMREMLKIPDLIWFELEPKLKRQVVEARNRARAKLNATENNNQRDVKMMDKKPEIIPDQHPTMKSKVNHTMSKHVNDILDDINLMTIDDDD